METPHETPQDPTGPVVRYRADQLEVGMLAEIWTDAGEFRRIAAVGPGRGGDVDMYFPDNTSRRVSSWATVNVILPAPKPLTAAVTADPFAGLV